MKLKLLFLFLLMTVGTLEAATIGWSPCTRFLAGLITEHTQVKNEVDRDNFRASLLEKHPDHILIPRRWEHLLGIGPDIKQAAAEGADVIVVYSDIPIKNRRSYPRRYSTLEGRLEIVLIPPIDTSGVGVIYRFTHQDHDGFADLDPDLIDSILVKP